MAFKFSLSGVKTNNAKAKAQEEAKARQEKLALDKVMADVEEEHGKVNNPLGAEEEHDNTRDVFVPTGNKRHFTGRMRSTKSGPGTLEAESRGFQTMSGFGSNASSASISRPSENVYTTLVAKASNLPPKTTTRHVRDLFTDWPSLKVTKIERLNQPSQWHSERPFASMKVFFDKDATTRDLDDAMMKLNDKKYLGEGYYLHLDRYLGGRSVETARPREPFGARWQAPEVPKGYAPPPDLGGANKNGPREDKGQLVITVENPPDLATTRMIHMTIEGVVKGGIEFEAALMKDARVKRDERFAFLWDSYHPLARYYRWKMHQVITGCKERDVEIYKGYGIWKGPTEPLQDEFAFRLGDLKVTESDADDDEEEDRPQFKALSMDDNYPGRVDNGYGVMKPRSRALLIWMVTWLPSGSIVADDIAGISSFAVQHATKGMDEVVEIILTNVIEPLQLTQANPRKRGENEDGKDNARRSDVQQMTLNALQIIHDVLVTTSKASGASYKYRGLIGAQLVERKVFEHLEQLPARLEMGRVSEKKYRDTVNAILKVWEDELFFEKSTLDHFQEAFNARERQKEQEILEKKMAAKREKKRRRKEAANAQKAGAHPAGLDGAYDDMDDMDDDDDDDDGSDDESVGDAGDTGQEGIAEPASGPASQGGGSANVHVEQEGGDNNKAASELDFLPGETAAARARRLRPKAEDMFASDEE